MYYKIIKKINKQYFANKMSKEWKKFVKELLKKYKFDDKVIISMFEYCKSKGQLEQDYIARVAESWYKNNIITYEDLENYCIRYTGIANLKRKIKKYMRREITQFEEAYIEKWVMDYKLSNNVIISIIKNAINKDFDKLDYLITEIYDNK